MRITAMLLRFFDGLRNKNRVLDPQHDVRFTPELMQRALMFWVRITQKEAFPEEYEALSKGDLVPKESSIRRLDPQWDPEQMVIRVGGRLEDADIRHDMKHQIILPKPKRYDVVHYIISMVHYKNGHAGMNWLMYHVRLNWWVLGGKRSVKMIVDGCITCNVMTAKAYTQKEGQLPIERLSPTRPWTYVGVDFTGPIYLRTDSRNAKDTKKAWICLFVCMSTRAVHLELVLSLTSAVFLDAYRRMVGRRGYPLVMYSDNAKTFHAASRELVEMFAALDVDKIRNDLATEVEWRFIPEHAPHWGGFYERMNRTIKWHLRRILGQKSLADDEMRTVLCEVEGMVNSRPLTQVTGGHGDGQIVTPSDLMFGYNLRSMPDPSALRTDDVSLVKRWKHRLALTQHFWRAWSRDYMQELTQFHNWIGAQNNAKVGDHVLVADKDLKRNMWKMGCIREITVGRDGLVRSVKVATRKGELRRAIHQLHPLECTADEI
jgi:hypothetical protein